jgi:bifunctional non-homologous end joining protein LigD
VPKSAGQVEKEITQQQPLPKSRRSTAKDSNWHVLEQTGPKSAESFSIAGCEIPFTDVDRNVWKDIPKANLIQYYHAVSGLILPYLKDRPLSLLVKPNGAMGPDLYIKDMEGRQPDCADIFTDQRRHPKRGKRNQIDYLVCNNEATLLYMINLGCVDINPWMSRTSSPEQPDFINIDLDPTDDDFQKVIEVCLAAKEVLTSHKLKSFVKTSGKTGMHIYLPVTGITFEQARNYSQQLGEQIRSLVPDIATTEITTSQRQDKVFVDPSQNDYADTLAAPYSARPFHVPTVSTPLDWKEVKAGLDPGQFTIDTLIRRTEKKGDLFDGALSAVHQKKNYKALQNI